MAFIGTTKLIELIRTSKMIVPSNEKNVQNGAYELSLGGQVFQTGAKPRVVKNLSKREKIYIDPGQFALLLTEEKVKIPNDKIAFISIKAKVKFNGLVNVSGFHVDPGFEGKLLFSVYNAGPSTIVLSQGTPYFPIWFADLDGSQDYKGTHGGQDEIPDEPIRALSQGDIASPNELSKRIEEVKNLRTKTEWVLLAIIAFLTGLTVKVWTDDNKLKDAVEYGYKKRTDEITSDSNAKRLQHDFDLMKTNVDSLASLIKKLKSQND